MKLFGFLCAWLLAGTLMTRANDGTVTLPELIQDAQQWAQENLDTNVLNALPSVDDPQVQQFLRELQQRYQGDYVVDLAALRQTARTVLPMLESSEDIYTTASTIGGSPWLPITPAKARFKNSWTGTTPTVMTPLPNICRRKRKCMSRASKPCSSSVPA